MVDKLELDVASWLSKKSEAQQVEIKDIGINSYQVRYSNVEEKIEELEEMLEVAGTNFHPILICKASPELNFRYDIIYGQRRLTAAQNLNDRGVEGWDTISANVIEEEVPIVIGQSISLMENEGRVPTSSADVADTIKDLRSDYELSKKDITEKLGIPMRIVNEVLWKEELVREVEEAAEKYKIKPKTALDLQRRCTIGGVIDVKKTVNLMKEIEVFDDDLRKNLLHVLSETPSISQKEAIAQAKTASSAQEVSVMFLKNQYDSLVQAADENEVTESDYVHNLTIEKLKTEKYLD